MKKKHKIQTFCIILGTYYRLSQVAVSYMCGTLAYHHCANFIWRRWTYKMPVRYDLLSVWVRLSIFSQLSIIQYVGLCVFSLPISFVMIEIIYILCLIIIIKSEVWTITNCLGLGHETMVCAVCLSIFLVITDPINALIPNGTKQQAHWWLLMPQSHPTTGPLRFLSPVQFLARKAELRARRNYTSVLFPLSHQATGPVWPDTSAYLWFGWTIQRTPRVPRVMPVRASYGPRTRIFNVFHMLRDSYGARAWPARVPYGTLTDT